MAERPRPYETGRATQACFIFSWVDTLSREGTRYFAARSSRAMTPLLGYRTGADDFRATELGELIALRILGALRRLR